MPHTVEEAYEVADAAIEDDAAKLEDELGDLLFQTYFLALLLEEQGGGGLEAVARRVHDKLVLRQITDEAMFEIQQLCGYEYVDTYATKKAEDVPVEPVPRCPPFVRGVVFVRGHLIPVIDGFDWLSSDDKDKIFHHNPLRFCGGFKRAL